MYINMGAWVWAIIGVFLLTIMETLSRPHRVYQRGYNSRNLPPGGWTQWFNVDYPSGAGDFETYWGIVAVFGRGCLGIPCKKPLAIKVKSVHNLSPSQEGNKVEISPRRGLSCTEHHQLYQTCADYRVRFYCAGMHEICHGARRNNRYNKHRDRVTTTSAQPITDEDAYTTTEPFTFENMHTKQTEESKNDSGANSVLEKELLIEESSKIFRGGGTEGLHNEIGKHG